MPRAVIKATLIAILIALLTPVAILKAELEGTELQAVNAFLDLLSTKTDVTFERNGKAYRVDQAVSHLKTKLKRAGRGISTLDEFIDHLATKSSISGKPYMIILPDGQRVTAKEYFTELLTTIKPN